MSGPFDPPGPADEDDRVIHYVQAASAPKMIVALGLVTISGSKLIQAGISMTHGEHALDVVMAFSVFVPYVLAGLCGLALAVSAVQGFLASLHRRNRAIASLDAELFSWQLSQAGLVLLFAAMCLSLGTVVAFFGPPTGP